ncbi:sigma-70 family RNA polymerase sigma factor [Aquipuribacter sp. MA13-6]|uniref:sigma-70 family RNA polymerase sigma factor n=1 Tax=unclassified Aquipuribacter TaxID=2635084 RepID=UPI003EEF0C34
MPSHPFAALLMPGAPADEPSASDVDVDALVVANLPLVGHCVGEVMSRVPSHVDRDDLAGAGVEGLLQAARSWRPDTGVPFTAHARTRVRGAIVDELRATDWASRGARSRARQAADTTETLTATLGRTPSVDEVADAMGVAPSHVHRVRAETHRSYLTSLEEVDASPDSSRSVQDSLRDPGMSPEDHVVLAEHLGRLRRAVDLLPDRVREAVRGHYLDEEPMASIAVRLGVTESRVSQLRAEGVAMLRVALEQVAAGDVTAPAQAPASRPAASLPVQGGRVPNRREAVYAAAVASAADSRTSIGVGSAVLSGVLSPRVAATG